MPAPRVASAVPRAADRAADLGQEVKRSRQRVLDPDGGDVGILRGDAVHQRAFLVRRHAHGRDAGLRRRFHQAGGEHHHEIDREGRPVDRAQVGDLARDLAAQQVDGKGIAELEAEGFGGALVERDQGIALVVLWPPFAGNDFFVGCRLRRPGEAAVAA
jgi:hypothetical protein